MKQKLHNFKQHSLVLLLLTLFAVAPGLGWGQTTVVYSGMGTITCPASPTATITPSVSGLTFSQITRGSGVTCGSASTGISGSGFNVSLASAISGSKWYTYSITSDATVTFTVSSLNIVSQVSNATGAPSVDVQYSIGTGAKISLGSFTPTASSATYTITPGSPISIGANQTINIFIIPNTLTASGTTCRVNNSSSVTVSTSAVGGLTPPALNADVSSNDVDNNIDITFTDDATWRAAITTVKIGGTALTVNTDYVITGGNIQLKPSGLNALLTTSGTKAVTVEATGYTVASVTQIINPGAATKLGMKTQPAAPATNGAVLATQPAVYIQDQYGNTTTSTASVVASVGAGTWTLGGTTSVAAVAGTTTYSGLTATSAAAVTGATISFASGSLTGITSGVFNIPSLSLVEPTNHATNFGATAPNGSNVTVTWLDNDGAQAATGFLILGNKTGTFTDPVDGTDPADDATLADGTGVMHVLHGVQTYTWTTLDASTPYYFAIYPYTNTGVAIDYKTTPTIPTANATTLAPSIITYTWQGVDNASWAVSTNWNPTRTTPATTDIMQFNDGTTKTITAVPTETIGQLVVTNNTSVNLQSGSAVTLTLGGSTGADFTISSGSTLNVSSIVAANSVTISLLTGVTASISGNIILTGSTGGTAHRFLAADASTFIFNNGSVVTAGTLFLGNLFGNTGTPNVAEFSSGSMYVLVEGSNPFGFAAPSSKVVFQPGSIFRFVNSGTLSPSLSGRTYADVEINSTSSGLANMTGSGAFSINNLTITSGNCGFNLTNSAHSIKGNISVAAGATFNFNPATAGTINLNGTSTQTISGLGTIGSGSLSSLVINNSAGVVLDANAALTGALTITSGSLTINPTRQLTVSGTLANAPGNAGLVIKSNATGTGSLIHNTADVPATIERYITGSSTITNMMYHYVSVPLTAAGTSSQFTGSYLFDFNEGSNQWNALGSSSATPLDNKKGYMIYYPGANTTYQFTGALNTGTFTPTTIFAGNGYNLVPNPYPSALDWNAATGWTKTNIAGSIYYWPAGQPAYNTNYAVWNGTFGTNSGTQYIPVGQAFFVQSVAAAPVLSMTNATRVHNGQAFWKSSDAVSNLLRIKSVSLNNNAFDEMIVNFRKDATTGFDSQFDANKLQGGENAPQLNSVASDDVRLAINTLPFSTSDVIVPLNFALNASSDVTFTASGLDSFYESISIYLEDRELNTLTDLRTQPVYTFSHNTGSGENRFQLRFKGVTGTNELPETIQGSVFVSQGNLFVDVPAMQQSAATIGIFDALGRQISTRKVVINGIVKLEAPVATGMYIVRVLSGSQTFTGKVIVK